MKYSERYTTGKDKDRRGRGMPRLCAYTDRNPTEDSGIKFHGVSQGKEQIYEKYPELKYKYRNREFWRCGYYVDTAGKNAKKIQEYI